MSGLAGGATRRIMALHAFSLGWSGEDSWGKEDDSVLYETNASGSSEMLDVDAMKPRRSCCGRRRNVLAGRATFCVSSATTP